MNPCPCGYLGDPNGRCRCTPDQIQRYRNTLYGPLLDRIDLHLTVAREATAANAPPQTGQSSAVLATRDRTRAVYGKSVKYEQNSVGADYVNTKNVKQTNRS